MPAHTSALRTKTVVVLGLAYGGLHAARVLAAGLPDCWKLVVIDRNSHANHVYVMPRYAVLPGHEHKAFIPYKNIFRINPPKPEHVYLQARVTHIDSHYVTLSRAFPEHGFPTSIVAFDYVIYALGSRLPKPLDLWASPASEGDNQIGSSHASYNGMKSEGRRWLKEKQKVVEKTPSVLVVGGGALGIQFATDIKSVYPEKKVTLLHSRMRLLPKFDERMHDEILSSCKDLGIVLILGERLDLSNEPITNTDGKKVVRTTTGRTLEADLMLLCTGQAPNTDMLVEMDASTVNENGLARVLRTMQLYSASTNETPYPHIFAIGDAADAFGAIAAGHNAFAQGGIAANNILRLIRNEISSDSLEALSEYNPSPPGIKVSLGLERAVWQRDGNVGVRTDNPIDLRAEYMWNNFGMPVEKDEDFYA